MRMNTDLIEKFDMLPRGARVLCAVSGGADSVCLLHFLCSQREKLGIEIAAAHYNHRLRAEESDRDEDFVRSLCRALGVECFVGGGDVSEYAREMGLSTELAARELRYDFLEKTADARGCTRIATAHNADDNAETMIFNLARGAGTAGLSGIPPVRGRIVRPLLGMTRAQIEEYLIANDLPHVEDSTNALDDCSRNVIRHRVSPVLRGINGAYAKNALRAALLLREDAEFLDSLAEAFVSEQLHDNCVSCEALSELAAPVFARVMRRLCPKTLEAEHIGAARELLRGDTAAFSDLPGIRLRRERGRIYFGGGETVSFAPRELIFGEDLLIEELKIKISSEILENCAEIHSSLRTFDFKYANICGNILCTPRADGDKIKLIGRGCTKSLKALFGERGLLKAERERILILRDDSGPAAVCGFGMAERLAASPGDRVLRIKIEKTGEF